MLARVLIVGISALSLFWFGFSPRGAQAAYDYPASQIAPSVANGLTMPDIAAILNETAPKPPYLVAYQLTTAGPHPASAAPLKVVQTDNSGCSYLAVFHDPIPDTPRFATYLGCSSDLKSWRTRGEIHRPAAQPDIRILSDDSVLYAEEYIRSGRAYLRIHYYGNTGGPAGLQALIANPGLTPTKAITLPGTASAAANGTPEFGRIDYNGSTASPKIEVNYHYFYLGRRDLNAIGTLTDFES